jgi:hypothetical protein
VVEGSLPPRLAYRLDERYRVVLDLETGRLSLFDRGSDPAETHDIALRAPQLAEELARGLTADSRPYELPPEQLERLRALGYGGL